MVEKTAGKPLKMSSYWPQLFARVRLQSHSNGAMIGATLQRQMKVAPKWL